MRSTSSPPSSSGWSPRSVATTRSAARHDQHRADDVREDPRPDRVGEPDLEGRGVVDRDRRRRPRADAARPSCGRSLARAALGGRCLAVRSCSYAVPAPSRSTRPARPVPPGRCRTRPRCGTRRSSRCPPVPAATRGCRASPRGRRSARRGARRRCPGGASTPRQLVKTRSMSDSVSVGTSLTDSPVEPLLAGHGQRAQLTGLDLALELAEPEKPTWILLPSRALVSGPPPSYGDVADLVGVDAHGLGELHREQVVRPTRRRAAADDDPVRVLLPGLDEVVHRLVRRVRGDQHAFLVLDQLGERRGVLELVVQAEGVEATRRRRARRSSSCARRPRRSSAGSSRPTRRRRGCW